MPLSVLGDEAEGNRVIVRDWCILHSLLIIDVVILLELYVLLVVHFVKLLYAGKRASLGLETDVETTKRQRDAEQSPIYPRLLK
jgi:hypothetical protein